MSDVEFDIVEEVVEQIADEDGEEENKKMNMKIDSEFPAVGKRAQVVFTGAALMKTPPLGEFVVLSKFPTLDGAGEIIVGHADGRHTEHLETFGLFNGILMLWTGNLWKTLDAAIVPVACRHERLNEDGICRSCGVDCRITAAA